MIIAVIIVAVVVIVVTNSNRRYDVSVSNINTVELNKPTVFIYH